MIYKGTKTWFIKAQKSAWCYFGLKRTCWNSKTMVPKICVRTKHANIICNACWNSPRHVGMKTSMFKKVNLHPACSTAWGKIKRHVENCRCWIQHVQIAAEIKGMLKEWKKACWKMEFLNPACSNCCRKKRHVEGIKTACWKMVVLNPACKKIQHVETATDKKRHVEVKSSMLKINKACWKKQYVPAQKFLLMGTASVHAAIAASNASLPTLTTTVTERSEDGACGQWDVSSDSDDAFPRSHL